MDQVDDFVSNVELTTDAVQEEDGGERPVTEQIEPQCNTGRHLKGYVAILFAQCLPAFARIETLERDTIV